jgi:membrane protease YdiL (CAAX protease family)
MESMSTKSRSRILIIILIALTIIAYLLMLYSQLKIVFNLKDFLLGICCSLIYFVNYYVSKLLFKYSKRSNCNQKQPLISSTLRLYFPEKHVVSIIILLAIIEEYIFRSYLLSIILSYTNIYISVMITSLLFSFYHFSKSKFIQLTIIGILFAFVTLWTNNLFPAVLGHIGNNLLILYKDKYKSINI